jgi:hypothetical protein
MKATFSSRGLVEKVARSRKLSVETCKEEKKDAVGRAEIDSRLCGVRVIRFLRRAEVYQDHVHDQNPAV